MPTPSERKALFFLAAVISLGAGVRIARSDREPSDDPAAASALRDQLRRVDSARVASKRGGRKGSARRPVKASGAAVDIDTASAALIETLNGVGPALAARIVAHRDTFGAFGSLDGLRRVRGIGPALSARLAPQVTFSRLARPQNAVGAPPPGRRKSPARAPRDRGFP
ncbi:MAG TPA: ComEA family DNA-binding protein [Gemmatimonadaceae bacterium]|nr:ComEA family DNA-binding protein [Gemmatimonadaceae bacterium]